MAHLITLLTDFGLSDPFVGIMKGVILGIHPECRLVDLTHDVPPQQIVSGALLLRTAVPFFAAGTIHVAVVDPEVGSDRHALIVETEKALLLGPDNGLLTLAAEALGVRRIFAIEAGPYTLAAISDTFHGRDVFAAVAAHLARGVTPEQCGRQIDALQKLDVPVPNVEGSWIEGKIVHVDHFGNLITNISSDLIARFSAPSLSVTLGTTHIRGLVTSYSAVPVGAPLAIVGSWGTLEVAIRNGNAAQVLATKSGSPVSVVGGAMKT